MDKIYSTLSLLPHTYIQEIGLLPIPDTLILATFSGTIRAVHKGVKLLNVTTSFLRPFHSPSPLAPLLLQLPPCSPGEDSTSGVWEQLSTMALYTAANKRKYL